MRSNEFIPFLKETGNYPLHRYIYRSDLNDDICSKYNFAFANKIFADEIDGMPADIAEKNEEARSQPGYSGWLFVCLMLCFYGAEHKTGGS